MFKVYLDSANMTEMIQFHQCLPISGVTTNPTILSHAEIGVTQLLPQLEKLFGSDVQFYVQVVSKTVNEMVYEAEKLNDLPYKMIVKVPTTTLGLEAMRLMKQKDIPVLATAIYSSQQGLLAMLCGADYLAPYVNRIDAIGCNGVQVVSELQEMIERHHAESKIIAASFKNSQQVIEVIKTGVFGVTLPIDIVTQLLNHPAVAIAIEQFNNDWQTYFGHQLSFES